MPPHFPSRANRSSLTRRYASLGRRLAIFICALHLSTCQLPAFGRSLITPAWDPEILLSQDAVLIGEIERYVYVGRNEEKGVFSRNSQEQTRTRYGAISQYEVLYASAAVKNRLRGTIYIGPIDSKEEKAKGKRIYLLKRDRVGDLNQIGKNALYTDQDSLPIEKSREMRDLSKMLERGMYDWRR